MTPPSLGCTMPPHRSPSSLKEVARTRHDNDVSALPVVDTRHHPIGVISEADLL
ncbi:CBS domain-containing protein [Streptomyces sp. NPDC050448]|uniref:CBS domain-containing protein n=1 Tax=Streptomyces sp. NPDC050448 TaxID=3155404 RepID=UPI00341B04C9